MAAAEPDFEPYVPASKNLAEFTWPAVVVGVLLGIVFGASSLYLVLKTGLTVSASIPVAVLSITLFRGFSRMFGFRRATILENNIVQTTGSAGESIAFGVGVTMPALLLLGLDMELSRVMTVGIFGGLLGILMMIPLRRAFIVKQHGKLKYPEGTACADVLIVGEEGGATAATVFTGFGLAFVHKFLMRGMSLWKDTVDYPLVNSKGEGLPGGEIAGELSPELFGVGYIIGPRIASIMLAGGVLAYLVITPLIVFFGSDLTAPLAPATEKLIRKMSVDDIRKNYILYIGAGAVATGGIISMIQALPLIFSSLASGLRDLRPGKSGESEVKVRRTDRDLPLSVVFLGALVLILGLAAVPNLGLGVTFHGLTGAALIVIFGFLFVTVSSRLTGEIGSSSNPISGMTVATLLFTCIIFWFMNKTDAAATLTAMTVTAVVCVAASNGGTTSQDLKTGFLVGATPRWQQIAILIGALSSAAVIGVILLMLNNAGTVWSKSPQNVPRFIVPNVKDLSKTERAGGQYADDPNEYLVWHAPAGNPNVRKGKYLVAKTGQLVYYVDPAINGRLTKRDDGQTVGNKFEAPKPVLMALIIEGIFNEKLPWELMLIGALIAVVLELSGVPSLPFAVGVYLPLATSVPIFTGGLLRWMVDKIKKQSAADSDMSPGVLMSSGYIAGGAIAGVIVAFFGFSDKIKNFFDLADKRPDGSTLLPPWWTASNWPSLAAFCVLIFVLAMTGFGLFFRGAQPKVSSPSSKPANKPRQN